MPTPRATAAIATLALLLPSCSRRDPAPTPTPPPTTATSPTSFADFRPSLHGFAFVNDFQGDPLPFPVPASLGLPTRFGLCGGMSFAAADYFLTHTPIPTVLFPPANGTPLHTFLYTRQAASLGPLGSQGLRFVEWMQLPDDQAHARTRDELPAILDAIRRHDVVILGLVFQRAGDPGAVAWHNHQVLAYDLIEPPALNLSNPPTDLRIYDPNYPKADDALIRITPDSLQRIVPGHRNSVIRGLFRLPYIPATPPRDHDGN